MGISNLFRPKYRHSDPSVRAEAVRELGKDESDVLLDIASSDTDSSVRRVAIERISDPDALAELAVSEADASARELAHERAAQLWLSEALSSDDAALSCRIVERLAEIDQQLALAEVARKAASVEARREAVAQLSEPRALTELARSDAETELRLAAIEKLDDVDALRSIALSEQNKQIGFAAVDRVEDEATLETIANKGKNKGVRARARKKLARLAPDDGMPSEEKQRRAERVQLCRNVEALAKRHEWEESYRQVEDAERRWGELGACEDDSLQTRFSRATERYHSRRARYGAVTSAPERRRREPRREPVAATAEPEARESDAEVSTAEGETAAGASPPEKESEKDPSERPSGAKERAADKLAALEKVCASLEGAKKSSKLRSAERKLQQGQSTYASLAPLPSGAEATRLVARYEEAHQALFIRVQELREADEWERWANLPRREELVTKAEALLESDDDKNRAAKLKELQAEWKKVGPVPQKKGQELWEKFKDTCDKVYARVKEHRAVMADQYGENLERKRELCERVEALVDSTDWDATAEEIKRLQAEWKSIGPVPRKHSNSIWKRFRAACDQFFERRKPHLDMLLEGQLENLKKKQSLCEQAEKLAESTDWAETAEALRQLQRDWRRIGHVPRKDVAAVSQRFRSASDLFFQRRQEERDRERREYEEQLGALEARIEEVEKSARAPGDESAPAQDELAKQTLELRSEVMAVGGRGEKERELRAAFDKLGRTMLELCPGEFSGTELDPEVNRKRKEKLCARAEALAPDEPEQPVEAQTPEQMAAKLREALSKNALGGVATQQETVDAVATIAELRASWQRLGPVPGDAGLELEARFERACKRALPED